MNSRENNRRYRLNQIVDLVSNQPMTIRELGESLEMNLNTVRKDVIDLVAAFRIHETGTLRHGAIKYSAGTSKKMPTVFLPKEGRDLDILSWTNEWLNRNMAPLQSVNPVDDMMPTFIALLALIFNAKNSADQESVRTNRLKLLNRIVENKERLANYLAIYKQLMDSPLLDNEKLLNFVESTEIPSDEIETTVRRYYSMLNTEPNQEVNDE